MERNMVKVHSITLMDVFMLGILMLVIEMVKEHILGLMETSM